MANALKLFDRRGFANTSLDEIARETGVKRAAIYYYFGNRAEILLNIIRPQSVTLVDSLREIVSSGVNFHDKLYLAMRNHLVRFDRRSSRDSDQSLLETRRLPILHRRLPGGCRRRRARHRPDDRRDAR